MSSFDDTNDAELPALLHTTNDERDTLCKCRTSRFYFFLLRHNPAVNILEKTIPYYRSPISPINTHVNRVGMSAVPVPDFLWELCVGDQETGDAVAVEEADEGVDFWIHDWLAHQGQGAVLDGQTFLVPLRLHSGDAWRRRGQGMSC